MDAGWNASANRYTGGKILVANLPGVDIGSTIEVEYEITTRNKPFVSGFEQFQLPDELEQKTVVFKAPAGLEIHKLVSGPQGLVSEKRSTADGKQVFEWHAQNVKALPAEQALPPEWVYLAGVSYFVGDARAYWGELNRTMIERAGKNEKAAETARSLTAKAETKRAAVQAIRDFISKSIRLAGPSFTELPLSELS